MAPHTIEVEPKLAEAYDHLSHQTGQSKEELIQEALERYLAIEIGHIQEIEAALLEVKSGDFASDAEVDRVLAKWVHTVED